MGELAPMCRRTISKHKVIVMTGLSAMRLINGCATKAFHNASKALHFMFYIVRRIFVNIEQI
jgi:hypothetical protein